MNWKQLLSFSSFLKNIMEDIDHDSLKKTIRFDWSFGHVDLTMLFPFA